MSHSDRLSQPLSRDEFGQTNAERMKQAGEPGRVTYDRERFCIVTKDQDEKGEGVGRGFNFNYPLAAGSDWSAWGLALAAACRQIAAYAPDALIVSLGVDTFKEDPISQFKLDSPDYLRMGERIAWADLPTLFVMEGGYAVEALGVNTVNVLAGFEQR